MEDPVGPGEIDQLLAGRDDALAAQDRVHLMGTDGGEHVAPRHDDPLEPSAQFCRDEFANRRFIAGSTTRRGCEAE